jgi:prepilin-type N-terminal cleavage/methylation domain-containing protein
MRPERTRRSARAGFTLLEVLAAVAVLGLVYSVLASAAIQGLRAEGDAGRRLRASLLADQRITEIEAQVAAGQTPEIGQTENQEDDFVIRTEVKPLDLQIGETKAAKRAKDRLDRAIGARPTPRPAAAPAAGTAAGPGKGPAGAPQGEVGSLLKPSGTSKQPMLRRIELTVTWEDGASEQTVRRTTYGIDATAAAPLIEQLVAAAEAEKAKNLQQTDQKTGQAQSAAAKKGEQAKEGSAAGTTSTGPAVPLQRLRPGTDPNDSMGDDR